MVIFSGWMMILRSVPDSGCGRDQSISVQPRSWPEVPATTLIPTDTVLEYAKGETPWRAELTEPAEAVLASRIALPDTPGLDVDVMPAHAKFVEVRDFPATLVNAAGAR